MAKPSGSFEKKEVGQLKWITGPVAHEFRKAPHEGNLVIELSGDRIDIVHSLSGEKQHVPATSLNYEIVYDEDGSGCIVFLSSDVVP